MAQEMKDSGIQWVGIIPADWECRRLRFLCEIQTGNQDTQDSIPDGLFPFYVRSPIVERSNKYTFEGPAILMAGDGAGAGRVFHYVDGKYGCHQRVFFFVIRPSVIDCHLMFQGSERFSTIIRLVAKGESRKSWKYTFKILTDRKSTRLNSSHM